MLKGNINFSTNREILHGINATWAETYENSM